MTGDNEHIKFQKSTVFDINHHKSRLNYQDLFKCLHYVQNTIITLTTPQLLKKISVDKLNYETSSNTCTLWGNIEHTIIFTVYAGVVILKIFNAKAIFTFLTIKHILSITMLEMDSILSLWSCLLLSQLLPKLLNISVSLFNSYLKFFIEENSKVSVFFTCIFRCALGTEIIWILLSSWASSPFTTASQSAPSPTSSLSRVQTINFLQNYLLLTFLPNAHKTEQLTAFSLLTP